MYVARIHIRYNLSTSRCRPDKRAMMQRRDMPKYGVTVEVSCLPVWKGKLRVCGCHVTCHVSRTLPHISGSQTNLHSRGEIGLAFSGASILSDAAGALVLFSQAAGAGGVFWWNCVLDWCFFTVAVQSSLFTTGAGGLLGTDTLGSGAGHYWRFCLVELVVE